MNQPARTHTARQILGRVVRPMLLAAAVATPWVIAGAAPAVIWDDGGTNTEWNTPENWNGNTVPSSSDTAEFASAGSTATVDTNDVRINALDFDRTGGFTVDAGTDTDYLRLGGGGLTATGSETYTLSTTIGIPTHMNWDLGTGSTVDLHGQYFSPGGRNTITKTGDGTLKITAVRNSATNPDKSKPFSGDEKFVNFHIADGPAQFDRSAADAVTGSLSIGRDTDPDGSATVRLMQDDQIRGSPRIYASGVLDYNGFDESKVNTHFAQMSGGKVIVPTGSLVGISNSPNGEDFHYIAGTGRQANITGNGTIALVNNSAASGRNRKFLIEDDGALDVEMTVEPVLDQSPTGGGGFGATKRGAGTVAFNGDNTYSTPTNVENGTLLVNGDTTGQGNYTVGGAGNPATLGGTGNIGLASGNTVTVSADGTIAPGQSIGSLTLGGDTVFGDSSALSIELDSSGQSDVLDVDGALDLSGANALELIDLGGAFDGSDYTIAEFNAGTLTGEFDSVTGIDSSYNVVYDDSAGQINLTVIPEPGSLALLGVTCLGLTLRRRR